MHARLMQFHASPCKIQENTKRTWQRFKSIQKPKDLAWCASGDNTPTKIAGGSTQQPKPGETGCILTRWTSHKQHKRESKSRPEHKSRLCHRQCKTTRKNTACTYIICIYTIMAREPSEQATTRCRAVRETSTYKMYACMQYHAQTAKRHTAPAPEEKAETLRVQLNWIEFSEKKEAAMYWQLLNQAKTL